MRLAEFTVDIPLADIDDDSQPCDLAGVYEIIESIDRENFGNNNHIIPSDILKLRRDQNFDGKISKNKTPEPETTPRRNQNFSSPDTETFSETLGGSLEDLVSHFDEKISHCFKDLKEDTEDIAPVQMRTQEEVMNESQIWWTLTGNFGNILPIDWSKSYARKLQLPALNLKPKEEDAEESSNDLDISDDEELAQALDLHSLIASQLSPVEPPPQTAEEVIDEIDEIIMQNSCTSEWTACSDLTTDPGDSFSNSSVSRWPIMATSAATQSGSLVEEGRVLEVVRMASCEGNLWDMSYKDLVALHSDLENVVKMYNETLVQELALREELEFEKETKNRFVSLLLSVQNKRRQWTMERKRQVPDTETIPTKFMNGESLPQYLTAIIPYADDSEPMDAGTMESLIKILQAVDEDNPNVPNMLTEYILNVICPTTGSSLPLPW